MADISKCPGNQCSIRNDCWRYNAPSDPYRQGWIDFKYDEKTKSCDGFWPMKQATKKPERHVSAVPPMPKWEERKKLMKAARGTTRRRPFRVP